jgi:hypothetical protein
MVTRFAGNRLEDFLSPGVRFDDMGADAVGAAAADFGEAIIGNARIRNAEIMAAAQEEAAKANADASQSASSAAQGANAVGTVAGVVGGLGSAAIMKFGGDGLFGNDLGNSWTPAAELGSFGIGSAASRGY